MRNAICFAGIARHLDESWPNIERNLLRPNAPDVFVHAWANSEAEVEIIRQRYQPKALAWEPCRTFVSPRLDMTRQVAKWGCGDPALFASTTYSMWYSIMQSHLLKESYRLREGVNYDRVIRARFDILFDGPMAVANYSDDAVWAYARGIPDMVHDVFMFGPERWMNVVATYFNLIEHVHHVRSQGDGIFCGETLMYEGGRICGIPYKYLTNTFGHLNHGDKRFL